MGILADLFRIPKFTGGLAIFLAIVALGLAGPLIYRVSPTDIVGPRYTPPSPGHPLGIDALGRDVLAQLLYGIRGSLLVGAVAAGIALGLSLVLGTMAAVFGGLVDRVIMVVSEIFIIIPSLLLMMVLAAYLRPEARNIWLVGFVIGITSWGGWARGFRSRTMSILQSEFIKMAILSGASRTSIILRDIVPIISPYILASLAMLFTSAITAEVGLTIVGVGMTKDITLGLILYIAQLYANITQGIWWTVVPPTLVMILIYLSLYLVAISLDEYFSPKLGTA
ncbi:MAG: ABC transporter permease [Ignisphaera sp.]